MISPFPSPHGVKLYNNHHMIIKIPKNSSSGVLRAPLVREHPGASLVISGTACKHVADCQHAAEHVTRKA
jgi:hypothetical protein